MIWVITSGTAAGQLGRSGRSKQQQQLAEREIERDIFFTARCYDYMVCKIF